MSDYHLFRGKRQDGDGWAYGSLLKTNADSVCIFPAGDVEDCGYHIRLDTDIMRRVYPETVGRLTGLEAAGSSRYIITGRERKKDLRIFEGDILCADTIRNCPESFYVPVMYSGSRFMLKQENGGLVDLDLHRHDAVIAGNIHDNPEVLITRHGM